MSNDLPGVREYLRFLGGEYGCVVVRRSRQRPCPRDIGVNQRCIFGSVHNLRLVTSPDDILRHQVLSAGFTEGQLSRLKARAQPNPRILQDNSKPAFSK
jgi:hypothetical protein